MLVIIQLAVGDDAGLFPCVKLADLLQRQQLVDGTGGVVDHIFFRQGVGFHDAAGDHDGAHLFQAANAHQHGGNGFVTTGNEHTAVIDAGVGLCLHQIDDGVTVGQGVVDAVMALCDAVTHIGGKIAGSLAAVVVDCLNRFLYELIQMGAARMAVTKGAFHHDLRLCKVFDLPTHAHLQRVIFRCQCADFLRTQLHNPYLQKCSLFLPFIRRTSYGFIVIQQMFLCKLSQIYPTLCSKSLGYIQHFVQLSGIQHLTPAF